MEEDGETRPWKRSEDFASSMKGLPSEACSWPLGILFHPVGPSAGETAVRWGSPD